jgi:hypothetical protein
LRQAEDALPNATARPEPVELTELVLRKVRGAFSGDEQAEAIRMLENDCISPFYESGDAQKLERLRLAAVKQSGRSLERLGVQIGIANSDWRNLLSSAEYPTERDINMSKLDEEAQRKVRARDRKQYEDWLQQE